MSRLGAQRGERSPCGGSTCRGLGEGLGFTGPLVEPHRVGGAGTPGSQPSARRAHAAEATPGWRQPRGQARAQGSGGGGRIPKGPEGGWACGPEDGGRGLGVSAPWQPPPPAVSRRLLPAEVERAEGGSGGGPGRAREG